MTVTNHSSQIFDQVMHCQALKFFVSVAPPLPQKNVLPMLLTTHFIMSKLLQGSILLPIRSNQTLGFLFSNEENYCSLSLTQTS